MVPIVFGVASYPPALSWRTCAALHFNMRNARGVRLTFIAIRGRHFERSCLLHGCVERGPNITVLFGFASTFTMLAHHAFYLGWRRKG